MYRRFPKLGDAAVMSVEFALSHKGLFGNRDLKRNYHQGRSQSAMAGSSSVLISPSKHDAGPARANII